jgi:hypothetical protein
MQCALDEGEKAEQTFARIFKGKHIKLNYDEYLIINTNILCVRNEPKCPQY